MIYASGIDYMYSATKELVSNASLAGIRITATARADRQYLHRRVLCPGAGSAAVPRLAARGLGLVDLLAGLPADR